ncbi:hypothetical protein H8356DRAFT_1333123 [Neocallimastix lanati (nom. inval.)]|nr:hypothetical protein H8356DRAFT_1333123 [Neocallimastix sp. JGI-2020a]
MLDSDSFCNFIIEELLLFGNQFMRKFNIHYDYDKNFLFSYSNYHFSNKIDKNINKNAQYYSRQIRWYLTSSILGINVKYESDLLTKITNGNDEELLSEIMKEIINEKFTVIEGEDYFIDNGNYRKLIIDENEKFKLIMEAHNIVEKCELNRPQPYPEPIENYRTKVKGPFVDLGLNFIGSLPKTRNNNQYIIFTVDYFTQLVKAESTYNITSYA